MSDEMYGKEIAQYKLERAKEEADGQIKTTQRLIDLIEAYII